MSSVRTILGGRRAAVVKHWMLLPTLVAVLLPTAWLGVRLAAAAVPEAVSTLNISAHAVGERAAPGAVMTSAQCLSCHQTEKVLSHPAGVAPKMAIVAAFPLENGQVDCITCHRNTFAEHAGASAANPLLRGGHTGQAFCAECHTRESITRQSQHPTALAKAHLAWPGESVVVSANPALKPRAEGAGNCLSCHDGTVARDAFGGLPMELGGGTQMTSHAVSVDYPLGTLRRGEARFKSPAQMDHRVRLTGGQVTCSSCHSLYSTEPALLVMRNDQSALCVSCHVQ